MARAKTGNPSKNPRRGRPTGVKFSDEQRRQILSFVEAGGSREAASLAAGIAPRTLRDLRARAFGRHPTRSALPVLRPFFRELDQAIGRRLLANEIWLSDNDPKSSLRYLRSQMDSDPEDEEPLRLPTAIEMQRELDVLITSRAFKVPRCSDTTCICAYHVEMGEVRDNKNNSGPDR